MQPMAPRKTIVGPAGRSPFKTVTPRTDTTPIKTVVGATARPPIKTVVRAPAAPPPKVRVGNLAAPPPKVTPGNLGTGGIGRLGPGFTEQHNNAARPIVASRSLGNGDGNLGRSVAPMPPRAQGPPNPVLSWNQSSGADGIDAGGMGPAAKTMGVSPRRGRTPRRPSNFFGG